MNIVPTKIQALLTELDAVIEIVRSAEQIYHSELEAVHPAFVLGARNLVHYQAFRSLDLTKLQKKLSNLGLSILGNTESHVLSGLENCRFLLKSLVNEKPKRTTSKSISCKKSVKEQKKHAKDLFGYRSKGRRVRIMVTLPHEAAYDASIVHDLLASGMNTARINCAHDGPKEWKRMIDHIHQAKVKLKKNCKITMDLGGPKIRTGAIDSGPHIQKIKPKRDQLGNTLEAACVELVTTRQPGSTHEVEVDGYWLQTLKEGDQIRFKDTRNKRRKFNVCSVEADRAVVECTKTSYLCEGMKLTQTDSKESSVIKTLAGSEPYIWLKKGDQLRILNNDLPGIAATFNEDGKVIAPACISCTSKDLFDQVNRGERLILDEGKIIGKILSVNPNEILLQITYAKLKGAKLKADKSINAPDSVLNLKSMTLKDKEDLIFVVQHADVVNFSFINAPNDIQDLLAELKQLREPNTLGVILKIETQSAYNNLCTILLEGMKTYPLGVMIARGDLAIETGWENMAWIQQEILLMCDAAYIPTVWATQVLENLAKKGIPSRSELTDAASSLKADCVMLNKGPYINNAVRLLDTILSNMNSYRDKNERFFPEMEQVMHAKNRPASSPKRSVSSSRELFRLKRK